MKQTRHLLLLAVMLLVAGTQAQAFKKQFKTPQWIYSNVRNAEITHVVLTDTATIVSVHKQDTTNGIRFDRGTHLVDEQGRHYRIMRSQGIPDERFDNFFSKATGGANDFKLLFEPLPRKTRFFDLIEGRKRGDFQILGIHDPKKPIEIPAFIDTVSTPQDFIRTDTVCVRGKIEGYSRGMGFSTMSIYYSNGLTNEEFPQSVSVHEDGTFEARYEAFHPTESYLVVQMGNEYRDADFYIVPGCTTVVNIHRDWTVDYKGSDEEVLRHERLMMSGLDRMRSYQYDDFSKDSKSLTFVELQEKLMGLAESDMQTVSYVAWRQGFNPWEHRLARVWNTLYYARWIFESTLRLWRFAPDHETTEEEKQKIKEAADAANWSFVKELPYNDAISLTTNDMQVILNRYEFAQVLRNGQTGFIKADAAFRVREDSILLANDMKVTGEDSPSLWGRIVLLRRTEYDFGHFREDKEELKKLVDLRREMLAYPALQANLDHLYAKELERQTLTYSLPDTEATRILRRMTDKYKGKYLLIDFWGMGCGPCRSAIESSKELREALRDHPEVDFLFIAAPESTEEAYDNYVKENLDGEDCHLITRDEYTRLMELFRFNGIPHYETLDKQGRVVRDGIDGLYFHDKASFEYKLEKLKEKLE